jgi:hypothetical protein
MGMRRKKQSKRLDNKKYNKKMPSWQKTGTFNDEDVVKLRKYTGREKKTPSNHDLRGKSSLSIASGGM